MAATTKKTADTRVGAVIEIHGTAWAKCHEPAISSKCSEADARTLSCQLDDGHESIFYPSSDTSIRQAKT